MKKFLILIISFLFTIISYSQTDNEDYKTAVQSFKTANKQKQKYDFDNAKLNFEKAANLFKKHNYTGNYIQCKYSIADIYIQQNKTNDAKKIIAEIEKLATEKYGEDNKFMANLYYAKGRLSAMDSKFNKAIEFYNKSATLNDKFSEPNNFFKSNLFSSIGNAYSELGNLDLALKNYQKDIEIKKAIIGDKHPILAVAYNNIANIYIAKAQLKQALQYIDKALELNINAYGKDNPLTADLYNSKGNIYSQMGQYDLALEFFNTSLNIDKKLFGTKNIAVAKNLNDIGIVYSKKQEFNKSLIYFKDSYDIQIDILGENHPNLAGICNNIGSILEHQGKHETSLKYYQQAVSIKTKTFGANHPELATYYNNIGINYYKNNNFEKALESYKKAISILENNYGENFPGIIKMYLNIADLYRKNNDFNKSLKFYQKSIAANVYDFKVDTSDYFKNPETHNCLDINKLLYSLIGKANVFNTIYKNDSTSSMLKQAVKTYYLCDTVISVAKKQAVKESDKINLGNQTKEIYESVIIDLFQLANNTNDKNQKKTYYKQMFYFAEKNKASVLSQSVASSNAKSFVNVPAEIIQKEKDLKIAISETEKSLLESATNQNNEKYQDRLFALNEELRKLNSQIQHNYPKYYNSKYKDININIKDLQSKLDDKSAIRSYFIGEDDIIFFTITKDDIFMSSSKKPDDFTNKIKEFNTNITSGYKESFALYLKSANYFYKLLFTDKLPKNIEKITIITDGILGLIPFEALITEDYKGDISKFKKYPFLIKKYEVNYSYSAGLLLETLNITNKTDNRKAFLGIAPVFEGISNTKVNNVELSPLPGSEKEIKDIENIFLKKHEEEKCVIGQDATETFFKNENLKDYKYIHIATHGIVNTDEPKLSGIFLYPEHNENDGILYSGEIYNLNLNSDLTVLSACETGIGKVQKSEGIIGLSSALLYAGSKNTIVSLWKVSDLSTHNLMVDFYNNLILKEEDKTKALHEAKIKMINSGGNFAHPYFWSPFILIGK